MSAQPSPVRQFIAQAIETFAPVPEVNWAVENKLMKGLHEYFESFSDKQSMKDYGGLWRWRIRRDSGAVSIALERANACRREVKSPGGYINREWDVVFKARRTHERGTR
jgi:hypothetical protein